MAPSFIIYFGLLLKLVILLFSEEVIRGFNSSNSSTRESLVKSVMFRCPYIICNCSIWYQKYKIFELCCCNCWLATKFAAKSAVASHSHLVYTRSHEKIRLVDTGLRYVGRGMIENQFKITFIESLIRNNSPSFLF